MKNQMPEQYRDLRFSSQKDGCNGLFFIPSPSRGVVLKVVVSDGAGWDHVSVSLQNRCPSWPEMCHVKDLFFELDETVVQFHPKISEYVNMHPYCLHLWRDQNHIHDLPPSILVGLKSETE